MNKEKNAPKLRFPGFTEEWEEKRLGDVADALTYGLNSAACEYDGTNGYIRITDIDTEGNYIGSNRVSPEGNFSEEYMVKEGDILFARTGASTGKTYKYKKSDGKLFYAGFLIRARINKEHDCEYIYYAMRTNRYNNWVKLMSMRSGQPGINAKEYSSYDLFLPSVFEQKKLANFLSTLDSRITLQSRKVEKLEELKKGYMQKIFSQELRFKREDGSEYGEWEEKRLGGVLKERKEYMEKGYDYPHVTLGKDGIIPKTERYDRDFLVTTTNKEYKVTRLGDICYNPANLKFGVITHNVFGNAIFSPIYITFEVNIAENSAYVGRYLCRDEFITYIRQYEEGSVIERKAVKPDDFLKGIIRLPEFEEQLKIADFLSSLDKQIEMEKKKLEKLQELKKGLLQQMFV